MEGVQKNQENYLEYFKPLAFGEVETENLVAEEVNIETGTAIYNRREFKSRSYRSLSNYSSD